MTPRRSDGDRQRHRPFFARASIIGLAAGLLIGAGVAVVAVRATPGTEASTCPIDQQPLRVVAAPEIAPVVSAVLEAQKTGSDACRTTIEVSSRSSASTAAAIQDEVQDRPDVWIPDSSIWTERSTKPGTGVPENNPSLAKSPLIMVVPVQVAQSITGGKRPLTATDLTPATADATSPVQWILPEPDRAAGTIGALLGIRRALQGEADASARLTTVIRGSSRTAPSLATLATKAERMALPSTEQQLYSYNLARTTPTLAAARPDGTGFTFDYPFVVLAAERGRRAQAAELLKSLQSDLGRRLFDTAGFRSPDGAVGSSLRAQASLDATHFNPGSVPDAQTVNAAIRAYAAVHSPTRLLAVIDVSGSMATPVPQAHGATRLNLALNAAVNGLAVYPDDTAVGLWTFATDLTPTTDYRSLAPLAPLGRGADGVSGRERVAKALASVQISKHGKSGLYDTVLAAVREVRRTWDPQRVNSVVVITDGGNNDPKGITLPRLLTVLRSENDPTRPVAVFAIAYGPTGDLPTLTSISEATNGKAYAAPDPRMISRVLRDAIGRRACTANC
jgi:Ca-activated chloride channel family protein